MHNVSRTIFVEQKKRVKTETEKAAANVPKTKVSTNIHIEHENGCKDTQTANKSVLGVFPIYKVHAHTTYNRTAAKVVL